jgi:hypothetical protein
MKQVNFKPYIRDVIMIVKRKKSESGQAIAEYATMLAMFVGISMILLFLLMTFSQYGFRLISLVCEYPYNYQYASMGQSHR